MNNIIIIIVEHTASGASSVKLCLFAVPTKYYCTHSHTHTHIDIIIKHLKIAAIKMSGLPVSMLLRAAGHKIQFGIIAAMICGLMVSHHIYIYV